MNLTWAYVAIAFGSLAMTISVMVVYAILMRRWQCLLNETQSSFYQSLKDRDRLFAEMTVYQAVLARLGRAVDLEWHADGELTATVRAATQAEMAAAADAGDSVH